MDGFMTTIFCDKAFRIIYKKSHRHTSVILDVIDFDTFKIKNKNMIVHEPIIQLSAKTFFGKKS